jgi:hypothetical protein
MQELGLLRCIDMERKMAAMCEESIERAGKMQSFGQADREVSEL